MTRQQDLDRLAAAIKDAEGRLRIFSQTLDSIYKELEALTVVEKTVDENVKFLKKKHIIALAVEFRKAKDELARIKGRMAKVRIDRDNVLRATTEVKNMLAKAKAEYATTMKSGNNVISFRRKDAKE